MLYERWRQVAAANRGKPALLDLAEDRRWTFDQLDAAVDAVETAGSVVYPQGIRAGFILSILGAWKSGKPACPLEPGQSPPSLDELPAGCLHIKMTSATTGAPRVIAFTAEQLAADAENIVEAMGLKPEWPNLAVISLTHSYGFSNLVTPLLLHGIPLILANSHLPEAVRRAARAVEHITLPAVPALWRTWHEANAIPENVRLAISAGAPLPLPLETLVFESTRLKIHNFYGASECGGIAYDASPSPRSDAACAGASMNNVRLSVGADGCLEVRSRAVGETYWPRPDPSLGEGCYRTSDLAELDGGRVFLRGRAGDLINVAGRKVSPESIEQAILTHPEVRECLVFGVPDADSGRLETIVACVVTRAPKGADELRQFALTKLPSWQVPREWLLLESLESSPRGKLSRADWRRNFLAKRGRAGNAGTGTGGR